MDLAPDVSQQALDRRVDVLVRLEVAVVALRDLRKPCFGLFELVGRQDPGGGEPPRMLDRRLAVVRQELCVLGAEERPHLLVQGALDPSRPRRRHVAAIMPGSRRVRGR